MYLEACMYDGIKIPYAIAMFREQAIHSHQGKMLSPASRSYESKMTDVGPEVLVSRLVD